MISTPVRTQPGVTQPVTSGILKLRFLNVTNEKSGQVIIGQQENNQTEWLIGRSTDCYLALDDPKVSREHAKIKLIDGAFYFSDIGSRWGSIINGKELPFNQLQLVQEGDTIYLGDTALKIEEIIPAGSLLQQPKDRENVNKQQYWADNDITVRCFRIIEETPDTKTFLFAATTFLYFDYLPGQFATIEVEIDGKSIRRPYSISSSPHNPYTLAITIKRVPAPAEDPSLPPGLVSNWLNDHLKEGDTIKIVGGAMGNFTCLPALPPKMLFIGAGSGITPLMSMARWVYNTSTETDIVLLQSAKDSRHIIFREELELMSSQMSSNDSAGQQLQVITTLTRPKRGQSWQGLTGRITKEMLQLTVPDLHERFIFCCGPDEFMDSIKQAVQELGFPLEKYKQESFGSKGKRKLKISTSDSVETPSKQASPKLVEASPAALKPEPTQNGTAQKASSPTTTHTPPAQTTPPTPQEIKFSKSEKTAEFDPDATLLDLAEEVGVNISHACRAGACGACKVRIQGEVHYDRKPDALKDEEKSKGYALACVAYPKTGVVVEA
ncbi:2Fe-2S iron-sulfur cluster-binding protein [Leptolyngbya sp. AN03gr2]|uniref:2Fe-2S iron-sulfur cluster-binding protein n=1 Tax=unclassified Leptolyngbya TaxID=2650499 RepID=UPI003D31B116